MVLEDLDIQNKGDDILLKIAKTFLDAYRELKNLKKISDINEEDALTLMVKHEKFNIRTKTDDILIKTKTFVDAYRQLRELRNENDENEEDALTLMVKHEKFNKVDELKPFLGIFDPNYYSKLTGNSAFSYAVEQNNLIFAEALLDKMSGKNNSLINQKYLKKPARTILGSVLQVPAEIMIIRKTVSSLSLR